MPSKFYLWVFCTFFAIALFQYSFVPAQGLAHVGQNKPGRSARQQSKSLKEALTELEQQFKVHFSFDSEVVEQKFIGPKVDLTGKLEDVLSRLLPPHRLYYEKLGENYYAIFLESKRKSKGDKTKKSEPASQAEEKQTNSSSAADVSQTSPAQAAVEFTVSGQVLDQTTGEGIPGVNVVLKGTATGTATNAEGRYSLTIPDGSGTLVFSYIGYTTEEIPVNNRSLLNITMAPDVKSLGEVVVVGYGVQDRRDVTGAVGQVKADEIKKLNVVNNVQNALQGQVAGVYVSSAGGQPGAGAEVLIRGQTSITGNNQVLYVVDGLPIVGNLNNINPQDIESIEVLKDASAAAIYGSRASSGVVLITTKRGKSGAPKISFDMSHGWQSLERKIDLMNGQEWATIRAEAVANTLARQPNANLTQNPFVWDAANQRVREGIVDSTDWQDAYYRVAPISNYYLSFSGGSDKSKVFVGGGLQNQQGIAPNTFFKRYSLRFNSEHKVFKDRIKVGNNLSLSYLTSRGVSQNNDFAGGVGSVLRLSPLIAVYKEPGTFSSPTDRFSGSTDPTFYGEVGNPLREALLNNADNRTFNIQGNVYAEIELLKGLKFTTDWGGQMQINDDKSFSPTFREHFVFSANNRLDRGYDNQYQINTRNFFTYDKTIAGNHKINLLAGHEMQDFRATGFSAFRLNFAEQNNPALWYLDLGDDLTATNRESATEWALLSYYGRINYGFKNRYLLTATIRRDGSSRFAGVNQWGNFPSFSAAWRLTEEKFFPENRILTDVKIRGGWGLLGNERGAGNYVTQELMNRGRTGNLDMGYIFGDGQVYHTGARPSRIPNPNLMWETSEQYNLGVDLGMFDNRLTVTADYFVKNTLGMIMNELLPIAGRGVIGEPLVNAGSLQNKGVELDVNYAKRTGAFTYNVGFNITTTRNNRITELASGREFLPGFAYRNQQTGFNNRSEVGKQIGMFHVFIVEGVFKTEEELNAHPGQPNAQIGDYKFRVDENGEPVREYYGNPWPLFIGGIKGNMSYRNFDLSLFFQGSYGNDILNANNWFLMNTSTDPFNFHRNYSDRFHPELNPGGRYAAPTITDPNNNRRISNLYIEDGSYLRLQNLQLGYNFPAALSQRINVDNLRIFLGGTNLFTLTKYTGYNPDLGVRSGPREKGIDRGIYPNARTLMFGLNLTL